MGFGTHPTPTQTTAAITDTSSVAIAANGKRLRVILQNLGTETVWLRVGTTAVADASYKLLPNDVYSLGERFALSEDEWAKDAIHAVCDAGKTSTLFVFEAVYP